MKLVIFGCGKIAKRIARSVNLVEQIELAGFASKDLQKAKAYSEEYGAKDYGDYEHFLSSDVDAVYIATYNQSHYELIRKCLEHHKNVICEKPMLFSLAENEEMFALAKKNDVLLMEALKSVFLPVNIRVKKMIEENQLGKIEEIYAAFCRSGNHGSDHWINDPHCGGALKDLGSYCVGTMNFLLGPGELLSLSSDRTAERAETTADLLLDYQGIRGKASVSNSKDGDCTLIVKGTRGFIRVDNFWKSGDGIYEIDGQRYELHEELISDFYYELKHFADLVDHGARHSPIMSAKASADILRITVQGEKI